MISLLQFQGGIFVSSCFVRLIRKPKHYGESESCRGIRFSFRADRALICAWDTGCSRLGEYQIFKLLYPSVHDLGGLLPGKPVRSKTQRCRARTHRRPPSSPPSFPNTGVLAETSMLGSCGSSLESPMCRLGSRGISSPPAATGLV